MRTPFSSSVYGTLIFQKDGSCNCADGHCSSSYADVVKVVVGSDKESESFAVHEDLLTRYSGFFKAACKKEWTKGQEKSVSLPAHDPQIFRKYLDLLYNPVASACEITTLVDNPILSDGKALIIDTLCKLWVTADFLGDGGAADRVIAAIVHISSTRTSYVFRTTIEYVIEESSPQSGLYKWLLDFISAISKEEHAPVIASLPIAFITAVLQKLVGMRENAQLPIDAAPYLSSNKIMETTEQGDDSESDEE